MGNRISNSIPKNIPFDNGFILEDTYLPYEIIAQILSYVDKSTLSHSCKYVCRAWYEIIKQEVWKIKAEQLYPDLVQRIGRAKLSPSIYKSIVWKNPFYRNLLKNGCGEEEFAHWDITLNAGNHWIVERPPVGVVGGEIEGPKEPDYAFVSSYSWCEKQQLIDLVKEGIEPEILDHYRPSIVISEWYAGRWDCMAEYSLTVSLLNKKKAFVDSFDFNDKLEQQRLDGWQIVRHVFKSYGPGIRYVHYSHKGKDRQFWAGHYGVKITHSTVMVLLNEIEQNVK